MKKSFKMKQIFLASLCIAFFTASECKKEGNNCHYSIKIENNSSNEIISGIVVEMSSKCVIDGKSIALGESWEFRPFNFCIERSLSENNLALNIYIIDPTLYNDIGKPYGCDSIEIMNKVLTHYELTLDDLKNTDFIISYP